MSIPENLQRGNFGSRLGFILAAAGSAIGLGNIWRFPYTAGQNGGGAFVLVYLACVILIGIPVMLGELSIGRATQRNPVGAFRVLAPGSAWPLVGALGVITGFGILAFYSVVAGWTVGYLYKAFMGQFGGDVTAEQSAAIFTEMIASPSAALLLTAIFLLLTVLVVRRGVSGGIEAAARVLMPVFFVLLLVLTLRAISLPGAMEGVRFMIDFDFSKITGAVAMSALGQALFSLSLGMGAMITFGSYLPRREGLAFSGVSVVFSDTLIALLAGFMIFPALFATGGDPTAGPGLVFVTMPTIFHSLPAGQLFGVAFYALLGIAALTSTISLLEVVVAYLVDQRNWNRNMACWVVGGLCFVLAVPSALGNGASNFWSGGEGSWLAMDFLSLQNIIWGNYSLSIGAILICLFVGWRWRVRASLEEIQTNGEPVPMFGLYGPLIRFICPLAVAAVLVFIIVTRQYF